MSSHVVKLLLENSDHVITILDNLVKNSIQELLSQYQQNVKVV